MTRTPRPTRATITAHTSAIAAAEGVKPQTLRDAARLIRATAGIPGLRWPARALREAIADHLEDVAEHMDEALIRIGRAVAAQVATNMRERVETPRRSDHHITPEQGRANLLANLERQATTPTVLLDHDAGAPTDATVSSFVMRRPDPRELYVDEGEEPHLFDADGDRLLKGTRYVVLPGPHYASGRPCRVATEGDILDRIDRSERDPLDVSGKVEDGPLAPKWPSLCPAYLRPEEDEDHDALDPDDYPDREMDADA